MNIDVLKKNRPKISLWTIKHEKSFNNNPLF